jgi:tetratricopeptide (TPR) repeat protein
MPELRISDSPRLPGQGGRRVEVTWQDGLARRAATAEIGAGTDERDGELARWYLEDYAESPADPAPALAASAEGLLARDGAELFLQVFSGPDAAEIWERARDRLGEVRVEVHADPGEGQGPAWELLRDPATDSALAVRARAFVRTHRRAAGHPEPPEPPKPSEDQLRVLLVISRPGGRADVPFRSVARHLVRGGADRMKRLDLEVLRPATFARLAQALQAAKAAGRPYHVVHFDGHGSYLDAAERALDAAGPVRPGRHGYLLFEAPGRAGSPSVGRDSGGAAGVQLVDGPTLGRLLTEAGVPVLVLNACRSAYAEARSQPGGTGPDPAAAGDALAGDVHARIRAYGSLAAEVADAGVPGVVAMRYNVYVATAAQFVADLYAHLLAGRSLGEAVTTARRRLAADPNREIGPAAVALQDWSVPVVYESAPLVLVEPGGRAAPLIRVGGAGTAPAAEPEAEAESETETGLPLPPDAGFFGRDETLLALDRAFDTRPAVLLHAFAGEGKSSTAAEFARWYQVTGGLDDPEAGRGPVLWSSFEQHLTADRAVSAAGDQFAGLLEANGIAWAAVTDPRQRRDIVLRVLTQLPALWVWDNVEPVTGFPAGAPSAWTQAEQDELGALLRDLAQTRCKVLLTSRRDERDRLGRLAARVRLRAMPMRESLQLATAIAARRGQPIAGADWRPLLRFAAGNPLTIGLVTRQALRENLTTTEQITGFVRRLQAGDAEPESGQDAALGRTRSLTASLDYGFASAFTDAERAHLAVLHLFRETVHVNALPAMGDPRMCGADTVPELGGLDRDTGIALLQRAADLGLLSPAGGSYRIHPALPWYFHALFANAYGGQAGARATRAYARVIGGLGDSYHRQVTAGRTDQVIGPLRAEEANLLHALDLARADGRWDTAIRCLQGLFVLYTQTGRDAEWGRLVAVVTPDVTDAATGDPLPGREEQWFIVVNYRARLARAARDWPAATTLQSARVGWSRGQAEAALAAPATGLTRDHRWAIENLAGSLGSLGDVLYDQDNPGCRPHYQEALALNERIGDRSAQAQWAGSLGNAYLYVPERRDLDQAERWFSHSLGLLAATDLRGRAACVGSLANVAFARFEAARVARQAESVLLKYLNDALRGYQEALDLARPDDHAARGGREHQLGVVYGRAGDIGQALRHYQRAIGHHEATGNVYGAGQARFNVALLLAGNGRDSEALPYARAALDNFLKTGPGGASQAAVADRLWKSLATPAS